MSTQDDALALLHSAAGEEPDIPWKLDWQSTISRLQSLVLDPNLVDQKGLNACGPAVFFRIWFDRDPLGAATFTYRLLKSGTADIGPITVTPSAALLAQDYSSVRDTANAVSPNTMPEGAEWMLLSGLRDSENLLVDYLGEPNTISDKLAGMTLPSTVATWLQSTNAYSTVVNDTTVFSDTWESLQALNPSPNADFALLVHSQFMSALYPAPTGDPAPADSFVIPQHFVMMLDPVGVGATPGWIDIGLWTWGRAQRHTWTSEAKFLSNYFGPIIAYA